MTALVLLSVAVLAGGWRLAPTGPACRRLGATGPEPGARRPVLAVVGGRLRRLAGRPPDDPADRRAGIASVLALLLVIVSPPLGVLPAVWCAAAPLVHRRRARGRRYRRVVGDLPDLVDLLALATGAGLTVRLALEAVAPRIDGPVGEALQAATSALRAGRSVTDALDLVADRLGDVARPLVAVLAASERYGAPLGPALERLGVDARFERRRAADELARRVPVKLLFPLVLCTLPAFALLTVVPLLAGSLQALRAT